MGENLFRVSLKELSIVRLVCRHCGTAVELPLSKLGAFSGECPACTPTEFSGTRNLPGHDRKLQAFAAAIRGLLAIDEFAIELPIDLETNRRAALDRPVPPDR